MSDDFEYRDDDIHVTIPVPRWMPPVVGERAFDAIAAVWMRWPWRGDPIMSSGPGYLHLDVIRP